MFATVLVSSGAAFDLSGGSSFWSSLPYTTILVPGMFAAPIVGGIVDKFNRPKVMVVSAALAAISVGAIAALWASGVRSLALLSIGCLLVGIGQSSLTPAWQAILPRVLGAHDLLGGGGLTSIASRGGEFVGPMILSAIIATHLPTALSFGMCALFYALAGICALPLLAADHLTGSATSGIPVARLIASGISFVSKTPPVRLVILLTGAHCALTMAYMGLLPGKASDIGHASVFSIMVTAVGLGSITGCLILAVISHRIDATRTLVWTAVASGLSLAWLGFAPDVVSLIGASVVVGASQAVFMATSYAVLQLAVGNELRGRIASLSNMLNAGSMSLVALLWGALATATSPGDVMVITGLVFMPIVAFALMAYPPLRRRAGIGTARMA